MLHYLTPPNAAWHPQVLTCSSLTGDGIRDVWDVVEQFRVQTTASGIFQERRRAQILDWSRDLLQQELWRVFSANPDVVNAWPELEQRLLAGKISPSAAVRALLKAGNRKFKQDAAETRKTQTKKDTL